MGLIAEPWTGHSEYSVEKGKNPYVIQNSNARQPMVQKLSATNITRWQEFPRVLTHWVQFLGVQIGQMDESEAGLLPTCWWQQPQNFSLYADN
jgi:hypothetical protein